MVQRLVDVMTHLRGTDAEDSEVIHTEFFYDTFENPASVLRPRDIDAPLLEVNSQNLSFDDPKPLSYPIEVLEGGDLDGVLYDGVIDFPNSTPAMNMGGMVVEGGSRRDRFPELAYPGPSTSVNFSSRLVLPQTSVQSSEIGTFFLQAPDSEGFQFGSSFSFAFWFFTNAGRTGAPLFGKGISAPGEAGWSFGINQFSGNFGRFWLETEEPGNNAMGTTNYIQWTLNSQYANNAWDHHVFTIDFSSGTYLQYRNGVQYSNPPTVVGTPSTTRNNNTQPFSVFGESGINAGSTFIAKHRLIDLVIFKDKILTPADALALYNNNTPVPPSNLTLSEVPDIYYPLRDLSPQSLGDAIGTAPSLVNTGCTVNADFPP